jgi:hypothetical protein
MSDLSNFSGRESRKAFEALVDDIMSRTGCPPTSVVTVLGDGGITPNSLELLDPARNSEVALDTIALLDIAGHRRDFCIAHENVLDLAFVNAMRGVRLGTDVGPEDQLVARVAFRSGLGANAAIHAIYKLPVPRWWLSDPVLSEVVEALAMLVFAPSNQTRH